MQPASPTHPPVCSRTPSKVTGVQDCITSQQTQTWLSNIRVITSWKKALGISFSTINPPDWHTHTHTRSVNFLSVCTSGRLRASRREQRGRPGMPGLRLWFLLEHSQSLRTRTKDVRILGHHQLLHSCCPLRTEELQTFQSESRIFLNSILR